MHGLCDDGGEGLNKAQGDYPELASKQSQVGMLRAGAGLQVKPAAFSLTAPAGGRG